MTDPMREASADTPEEILARSKDPSSWDMLDQGRLYHDGELIQKTLVEARKDIAALSQAGLEITPGWSSDMEAAPRECPSLPGWPESVILGFAADEEGHTLSSTEGHWRPEWPKHNCPACWVSSIDPDVPHVPPQPTHWRLRPLPPVQEKEP